MTPSLLPSGFYDLLPPKAFCEQNAITGLLDLFSRFGYAFVSPPLAEFESSLLSGRGEALASQTMRVLDAISQNMLGIRSDITLQIARIASTRMKQATRPLRLCYAGQILQTKAENLANERQLTQAGIELIGSESLQADAEVMLIAAEALKTIGIDAISLDINLPGLLYTLCPEAHDNPELQKQIKDAILCKDVAGIAGLSVKNSALLAELVKASGSVETSLKLLEKCAAKEASQLRSLIEYLTLNCPAINLTLDALEYRGFDYHHGISFSLFSPHIRHEIGRGGRYKVGEEPATGFTLYITHLLPLLPEAALKPLIVVDKAVNIARLHRLQKDGYRTVYALTNRVKEEAETLQAAYYLTQTDGEIEKIEKE